MKYCAFLITFLMITPAFAQGVNWNEIGRPVDEDGADLYDRYVYFDEDKTVNPNLSLNEPLLSRQAMASWINDKVSEVMTLSQSAYRQEINQHKIYFTDKGLRAYIQFLENQGVTNNLNQTHSNVGAIVKFTPDILADASFGDIYRWNADVPLMLSYRNSNLPQKEVLINVDVVRVPFGKNTDGLAFDHWAVKERSTLEQDITDFENEVDDSDEDPYQ